MIVHPYGRFDNSPLPCRHIEAHPLAAAMGAEIVGAQIDRMDDATFGEIRDSLFRHGMIFLRRQPIDFGAYEDFAAHFGRFAEDAYTKGVEGHPDIQPVIREADARDGMIFGSGWHTDSPFLAEPPAISMLLAKEVPPWGGDTIWANAVLAYETLDPETQARIERLRVRMSMARVLVTAREHVSPGDTPLGRLAATRNGEPLPADLARKVEGTLHAIVRSHPVTGSKALYCDGTYAVGIEGMDAAESQALLDKLVRHLTQHALTCRLRWQPGTLAIWDNRLTVHQAFNDYDGFRREMYRMAIAGEAPR